MVIRAFLYLLMKQISTEQVLGVRDLQKKYMYRHQWTFLDILTTFGEIFG